MRYFKHRRTQLGASEADSPPLVPPDRSSKTPVALPTQHLPSAFTPTLPLPPPLVPPLPPGALPKRLLRPFKEFISKQRTPTQPAVPKAMLLPNLLRLLADTLIVGNRTHEWGEVFGGPAPGPRLLFSGTGGLLPAFGHVAEEPVAEEPGVEGVQPDAAEDDLEEESLDSGFSFETDQVVGRNLLVRYYKKVDEESKPRTKSVYMSDMVGDDLDEEANDFEGEDVDDTEGLFNRRMFSSDEDEGGGVTGHGDGSYGDDEYGEHEDGYDGLYDLDGASFASLSATPSHQRLGNNANHPIEVPSLPELAGYNFGAYPQPSHSPERWLSKTLVRDSEELTTKLKPAPVRTSVGLALDQLLPFTGGSSGSSTPPVPLESTQTEPAPVDLPLAPYPLLDPLASSGRLRPPLLASAKSAPAVPTAARFSKASARPVSALPPVPGLVLSSLYPTAVPVMPSLDHPPSATPFLEVPPKTLPPDLPTQPLSLNRHVSLPERLTPGPPSDMSVLPNPPIINGLTFGTGPIRRGRGRTGGAGASLESLVSTTDARLLSQALKELGRLDTGAARVAPQSSVQRTPSMKVLQLASTMDQDLTFLKSKYSWYDEGVERPSARRTLRTLQRDSTGTFDELWLDEVNNLSDDNDGRSPATPLHPGPKSSHSAHKQPVRAVVDHTPVLQRIETQRKTVTFFNRLQLDPGHAATPLPAPPRPLVSDRRSGPARLLPAPGRPLGTISEAELGLR